MGFWETFLKLIRARHQLATYYKAHYKVTWHRLFNDIGIFITVLRYTNNLDYVRLFYFNLYLLIKYNWQLLKIDNHYLRTFNYTSEHWVSQNFCTVSQVYLRFSTAGRWRTMWDRVVSETREPTSYNQTDLPN